MFAQVEHLSVEIRKARGCVRLGRNGSDRGPFEPLDSHSCLNLNRWTTYPSSCARQECWPRQRSSTSTAASSPTSSSPTSTVTPYKTVKARYKAGKSIVAKYLTRISVEIRFELASKPNWWMSQSIQARQFTSPRLVAMPISTDVRLECVPT